MARRFIVDTNDFKEIPNDKLEIVGNEVKHIHVLRHKINDEIIINANVCKILDIKKDKIVLEILGVSDKIGEPNVNITLYMAMLKGDKMDLVIQKAVELGVKYITPFISKNVVVKLDEKSIVKKQEKFQRIADEACKQCGRTDKVVINDILSFNQVLTDTKNSDVNIFAYEKETIPLKKSLTTIDSTDIKTIGLIIGSEGGFTEDEAETLRVMSNTITISLGERILRAETAAIYLLSIIMYELD